MSCPHCRAVLAPGTRVCGTCHALQPVIAHSGRIVPGATLELGYGRIVVQTQLGDGGMGVVWQGWLFFAPDGKKEQAPLPMALKVLRPHDGSRADVRGLFSREAEALRSLNHPNIVRFYDFFEWGGSVCLAMELVLGGTLAGLIARQRTRAVTSGTRRGAGVPLPRAWYYFQQLLGALAATHALGIVHRDVKPSNVLLRKDGIVKLSDFGIARLVHDEATSSDSVGTAAYMAPEQVMSAAVDGRSDLYSAGVVLYETLAGRPPFSPEEMNEFSLRQAHVEGIVPPIRVFAPEVPATVEAVLARALAKDPKYRYATAMEFGDAMKQALGEAETAEWSALKATVMAAPEAKDEAAKSARQAKLSALSEVVESGYRAASPTE